MIRDRLLFLRECVTEFRDTGSMFPSSRWVARELTEAIRNRSSAALNILEAGAGTGPVTAEILKCLGPNDHLTVCEINANLMRMLQVRLKKTRDYQKHKDRVTFFEGPVQAMSDQNNFDVIVCSIPFFNLPIEIVKEIFTKFETLSASKCTLTFFSYLGVRYLAEMTPVPEIRKRAREVSRFLKSLGTRHKVEKKIVWLNFTPIIAYRVELKGRA